MISLYRGILLLLLTLVIERVQAAPSVFYTPGHPYIRYMGRIDFTRPDLPRFWQPGVTVSFRFKGEEALIYLRDEQLWGTNQNYIELVVDGQAVRLQTTGKRDTISVKPWLGKVKNHTVILCKNTEANIGYLEFEGVRCESLLKPAAPPARKIEAIGNSITCGASADTSAVPCGNGKWQDQHNAWLSYAAVSARQLNAQVHLSSVSGIGLMRSCCNMDIIMPQVYDKISMRDDTIGWNFGRYQPDLVTVCLGQNDGIQPPDQFRNNYLQFLSRLRFYYPRSRILLLSSPMADNNLREFLRSALQDVVAQRQSAGDRRISYHVFEKAYTGGCDYHPSVTEHGQIAMELTAVIKKIMKWN